MNSFNSIFLLKLNKYLISGLLILLIFSSCDEEAVAGCMDSTACNFNANATEDNSSCTYAQQNQDCDGNCLVEVDCAENCGGTLIEDCNGDCGGTAVEDCNGDCGGTAVEDCNGDCGGTAVEDECGICDGSGLDENGCCDNEVVGCTGQCGDESYVDCNADCCEPLLYNECLDVLVDDSLTNFCQTNFNTDSNLLSECESLVVTTLDDFCEFHFGCASIDCSGQCTGGNTGLPNYEICDCFNPDALNYWCNDGGQCPVGGSSVESQDALDCQEECIFGIPGSYIAINPLDYDNGILVYNDSESCCITGCSDANAANYDDKCIEDYGTCQTTNYIKVGQVTDSTIELLINSNQEIGGFQFELSGVTLESGSGSGGLCEDSGLTVSTGPNGVLAFSLTGAVIPITDGQEVTLTTINYATSDGSEICLPNSLIISDIVGASLDEYIVHYQSSCP